MCDLFITIFSRIKILTFINDKKITKNKKKKKKNPVLLKLKQLYPPRALMGIYKSCCELVFLSYKTTTIFELVSVAQPCFRTLDMELNPGKVNHCQ